jgi:hypothetical protein
VTLSTITNGSVTFQWTKNGVNQSGATSSTFTASKTGTYAVVVTNACGTATSNTISVAINALPVASMTPSGTVTICSGQNTILTANSGVNLNYQWKKGNSNISGATNQTYSATTAGNFKVIVTNALTGCSKTSAATKIQITCKEEFEAPGLKFKVFPNPTSNTFHIDLGNESFDLRFTDIFGREIASFKNVSGNFEFGNELPDGIYFLEVKKNAELVELKKLAKAN